MKSVVIVNNKVMNILQKIFTDYYEEIKYTMHTHPVVIDNIDRMITYFNGKEECIMKCQKTYTSFSSNESNFSGPIFMYTCYE